MYEENFEAYLEQMSQQMTATGQNHAEEKKERERKFQEEKDRPGIRRRSEKSIYVY